MFIFIFIPSHFPQSSQVTADHRDLQHDMFYRVRGLGVIQVYEVREENEIRECAGRKLVSRDL